MAKKAATSTDAPITADEVREAQDEWSKAIVDIGRAFVHGEDVVDTAAGHIRALYAYEGDGKGTVLFKPTKAARRRFRPTFRGALSYFVGDALAPAGFPEDQGFAIAPYVEVRFANAGLIVEDDRALAMGVYYFTKTDGQVIPVEYTFGYRRSDRGLLIDLHHSSLPFQEG